MDKQELSKEYLKTRSEIQAHLTLVQILMGHIQVSRQELETLNQKAEELQKQLEGLNDDKQETE